MKVRRSATTILFFFALIPLFSHGQETSAREFMSPIPLVENPAELSLDPALINQLEAYFPQKSNNRKNLQRVIFSGNSKSRKVQAAQWIAFHTRQFAYRVHLSRVVSEHSNETEKNLELVFDEAENSEPILFFDEADALFGNKGENDEGVKSKGTLVAYFLDKAERYRTTIIISSAQSKNLDPALFKKFQKILEIK